MILLRPFIQETVMKRLTPTLIALCLFLGPSPAWAGPAPGSVPGSMEVRWDAGAKDVKAHPHSPIQVHPYDAQTFILRENLCDTWEAPFIYLLVGSRQALLIDTGDVADPKAMPLEKTVMALLPGDGPTKLPLVVVHSHGHLDHRLGDAQFEHQPGVQVVPSDLDHVRKHFGFTDWPNGTAEVDLGGRIIDVLPVPGHHRAHVAYYDRNTGILFSGDFLLPGRLLVDDIGTYRASAQRLADFLKSRPLNYVLGGHIEKNRAGELLPWQSTYHPDERPLPLAAADVFALPAALRQFNGFHTETGAFVIENPIHILMAIAGVLVLALAGLGVMLYRFIRRRRRRHA
jgi:glyoxylase-like metal-dependent hydrolase (beta-lactamase superfamily II)